MGAAVVLALAALPVAAQADNQLAQPLTYSTAPLADLGLNWQPDPAPVLQVQSQQTSKAKSPWLAVSYAVFPGYVIPWAFGHDYAEAKVDTYVLSAARLTGRAMWLYAFFENVWGDTAQGSIAGQGDQTFFYLGLVLDIGGYLFDILHSPVAVADFNRRFFKSIERSNRVSTFIDIVEDGPACGVSVKF